MGAIGGLIGVGGGAAGTGFSGPQGAQITPGTTADQISTAYGGAQNSLQSQQALLSALQAQNGLGNQSQVYNQLQGIAAGTGPNPAQAMLNQATGQNVANQAALMAGQRGASGNVGLLARQAAQQGANLQQQAVGQGATMQANQSLNAINSAGGLANTQAANQIGATTTNTQAQQNEQQILQNALAAQNNANVQNQANINNANTSLAQTTMQGQQGLIGGVFNSLGGVASLAAAMAQGGIIEPQKYANGGLSQPIGSDQAAPQPQIGFNANKPASGPQSALGQFMGQQTSGSQSLNKGMSSFASGLGHLGKVLLSDGSNPSVDTDPQAGDMSSQQMDMSGVQAGGATGGMEFDASGGNVGSKLKTGGKVPGKAKVPGNSYANDTVKALLSPGEVVIPKSVMESSNPADGAARFVAAVLARKKKGL